MEAVPRVFTSWKRRDSRIREESADEAALLDPGFLEITASGLSLRIARNTPADLCRAIVADNSQRTGFATLPASASKFWRRPWLAYVHPHGILY